MPIFPNGSGQAWQVLNATGLRQNNHDAQRAPEAMDDVRFGYERGSRWWYAGAEYVCKSNIENAAVWVPANDASAIIVAQQASDNVASAVVAAQQARDDVAALQPGGLGFASRAAVLAATVPVVADVISVAGLQFKRDASGTALVLLDGQKFSPLGDPSPEHWGATPFVMADQSAAVQAALNYAKASWSVAAQTFGVSLDLRGKAFVCDQSIDCTGLRQPRLTLRNGSIYSRAAGRTAFDAAGTNGLMLENFMVYGDQTSSPAIGIFVGRCLIAGSYSPAPLFVLEGRSGCAGYFSKAALLMFASEVSNFSGSAFFYNRHRSRAAVSVACIDSMATAKWQWGSALTSEFQTLDPSDAQHSNICHDWGQVNIRREADYNLTITGISKAAQAVVTFTAGTLAAANISVGDYVYIEGGDMTEVAHSAYQVVATGTDQITLAVDTTAATTYTSGAKLQNNTGPGLLSSGMRVFDITAGYILTYGAPGILIDGASGAPSDWHLQVQFEKNTDKAVTFRIPAGRTITVPGFTLHCPHVSQLSKTAVVFVEETGNLIIEGGGLYLANLQTAPSQGVMAPAARIAARGFDIRVPMAAALPNITAMAEFSGRTMVRGRSPYLIIHGQSNIDMQASTTPLTSTGLRWNSGGLFAYRPEVAAERRVQIQDSATTGQLNSATDRVNTTDKWAGKCLWNVTTLRPVYAAGASATSTWVFADGATAHTPA